MTIICAICGTVSQDVGHINQHLVEHEKRMQRLANRRVWYREHKQEVKMQRIQRELGK